MWVSVAVGGVGAIQACAHQGRPVESLLQALDQGGMASVDAIRVVSVLEAEVECNLRDVCVWRAGN